MQLEDHVGDILGKARNGVGLSVEEAAAAASISPDVYCQWEESGDCDAEPDLKTLSAKLDLDDSKLKAVADGWVPEVRDLGAWREFRVVSTHEGMEVHCYLIWDEVTREAALFDTGFDAAPVLRLIETEDLSLRHLFITHGHHDHMAGLAAIRGKCPKVRLHTGSTKSPVEHRNRATDFIHLGSLRITNRPTPGHAEDGVTYVVGNWPEDAPGVAIVGDALFAGSMGGAGTLLGAAKREVREQIFSLPDTTLVCPGHGPLTTVGEEKRHNPFFRENC